MSRLKTMISGVLVLTFLLGVTAIAFALASGPPDADASVYSNDTSLTQNLDQLRAESGDPVCNRTRWSYVKWNLAGVPPGTTISTASMTYYVNLVNLPSGAVPQISLFKVLDDSWQETSVTSGNGPAFGDLIQSVPVPAANTTIEFNNADLVTYLQQEAAGDDVASFGLAITGNCGNASVLVRMYSKDSPNPDTPDPNLNIADPNAVTLRTMEAEAGSSTTPLLLGGIALLLVATGAGLVWARRNRMAS